MTRVIAGQARGRQLTVPRGRTTRPTGDRVREAMFAAAGSVLGSFEGTRVLDLYAGSGAAGLESLSRLDLEQRREGDVLGATQAGRRSSLKLLSLLSDEDLIRQAREEASAVVRDDPDLAGHQPLAEAIADLLGPQRAEFLDKT